MSDDEKDPDVSEGEEDEDTEITDLSNRYEIDSAARHRGCAVNVRN